MEVKEKCDCGGLKFIVFAAVICVLAINDLSIWWAVLLLLLF